MLETAAQFFDSAGGDRRHPKRLLVQSDVGLLKFDFHLSADFHEVEPMLLNRPVDVAPAFPPLLFTDLVALLGVGLWALCGQLPTAD